VFHHEDINGFNYTDVMEHQILLGNTAPVRRPQYRTQYAPRHEMEDQVVNMLDKGFIRASKSSWSAPAFLFPKKTAAESKSIVFVFILESLMRRRNFYPYGLPEFEETTSTIFESRYFSFLDCYSGLWQVPIKEEHKEHTGFTVQQGHYEFNRINILSMRPTVT